MVLNDVLKLAITIGISELAGRIGAFSRSSEWYQAVDKPVVNPPNGVFGPVWILLYALMGVSAFLIWKQGMGQKKVKIALGVFGIQLFLNAIWSIIFFGFNNPGRALVDIVLLWVAIVFTMVVFYKISKSATYLLIPYILWVSFATYLNFAIWLLN